MSNDYTPVVQTTQTLEAFITEVLFDQPTQPMHLFDILGVDKASLLMALYNDAKVVHARYDSNMTYQTASRIVEGYESCGLLVAPVTNFTGEQHDAGGCGHWGGVSDDGVFMGRRLNIDISGDEMNTEGYDRANGEGRAFLATKTLLAAIEGGHFTPALEYTTR